ncbi:aspartate/glutamate racemase family protein [Tenacibaculum ovolyticum]|uniref:aspartate/glutamate racemase family protein n=1 Tax=Tenacibaculum ovolyticum TaxID=104270 RepID=UPI0022F39641|nr:aspartate/glutamate racemase family protein [Tenacibaculum ovolyticum]WBX78035.1 aspartate/glutamate racemase family protein [Tenacibaculum ovolyticum]
MKTIGLIGGITPQSTIMYYQVLNKLASETFGEKHSAKVVMNAVDFGEISKLQSEGRWDLLATIMVDAAKSLQAAGAHCILICANTMHLTIAEVREAVTIPVIHIAEATGTMILESKLKKVALLGTKYTMEKTFYTDVLKNMGIEAIIPEEEDRTIIHDVIYNELSKGILNEASQKAYIAIIEKLAQKGAEGVILGCTEIPLLVAQKDVSIPVFDTTTIHATAAFKQSV